MRVLKECEKLIYLNLYYKLAESEGNLWECNGNCFYFVRFVKLELTYIEEC